jgi:hypothetical protein
LPAELGYADEEFFFRFCVNRRGQVWIRLRLAALGSLWQRMCQQEVLSTKNGASRKHHKIRQLQQISTTVRHQGKTKTANFSRFTFMTFLTVFWATWFNASCIENFKNGLRIFPGASN